MNLLLTPKERRRRSLLLRLKLYGIFIVMLLVGWGGYYAASHLPLLKITTLTVQGTEKLQPKQVIAALAPIITARAQAQLLGFDNIFSWPAGAITINKPIVKAVQIEKNYIHRTVTITVQERKKFGRWCQTPARCFWFDAEGVAFETTPNSGDETTIKDRTNIPKEIELGAMVIESNLFTRLKKILDQLRTDGVGMNEISWNSDSVDITIQLIDGPQLLFNLRFDPSANLAALRQLQQKSFFKTAQYVDLRVENRVFYK